MIFTMSLVMYETVSVVIATYNRPNECKLAIDSVLAQTHAPFEIIVIDDGSTIPFQDDRVRIIRNPVNTKLQFGWASPGYIRTLGIKESKGDFVAFLDDDDYWLPMKLETQLNAMRNQNTDACCSDALYGFRPYNTSVMYPRMIQDHHLNEIKHLLAQKGCFALESGIPDRFSHKILCAHNLVITSSILVRRSILEEIGYMNTVPLGQEDWSCWIQVSRKTDISFVSDPCLFYDTTPSTNR